jgi:hypothetical protein
MGLSTGLEVIDGLAATTLSIGVCVDKKSKEVALPTTKQARKLSVRVRFMGLT